MPGLISLVGKLNLKDVITCTSDPTTKMKIKERIHSSKFIWGLCVPVWDLWFWPDNTAGKIPLSKHKFFTPQIPYTLILLQSTVLWKLSLLGVVHEWTSSPQRSPLHCVGIGTWHPLRWFQNWRFCNLLQALKRTMGEMNIREVSAPIRKTESTLGISPEKKNGRN